MRLEELINQYQCELNQTDHIIWKYIYHQNECSNRSGRWRNYHGYRSIHRHETQKRTKSLKSKALGPFILRLLVVL